MDSKDMNMDDSKTGWNSETVDYYDFGNDEFDDSLYGERFRDNLKKPFKDYFHTDKNINTSINKEYEI